MPKVYMLVGVPGSGKSTWLNNQGWAVDMPVISSDRFINDHAEKMGKTYNEVFDEYIKIATKLVDNQARVCHANGYDCIWDQTNTSAKSRKGKLDLFPGYEKIAVVFRTPEKEEHDRRLASRPGKSIPVHVMNSMIENFQEPTLEEGFAEVWHV